MSHIAHYNWRRAIRPFPFMQRFFPGVQTSSLGESVDMTPDGQWIVAGSGYPGQVGQAPGTYVYWRNPATGVVSYHQQLNTDLAAGRLVAISNDGLTLATATGYEFGVTGYVRVFKRTTANGLFNPTPVFQATENLTSFGYSLAISPDGNIVSVGAPYSTYDGVAARGSVVTYAASSPGSSTYAKTGISGIAGGSYPAYTQNTYYGASIAIKNTLETYRTYDMVVGATNDQAGSSSVRGGIVYSGGGTYESPNYDGLMYATTRSGNYLSGSSNGDSFGNKVALSTDGRWLVVASGNSSQSYFRVLEYLPLPSLGSYYTRWTSSLDATSIGGIDISDDGSTIAVGRPSRSPKGAVDIYKLNASTPDQYDWSVSRTIAATTTYTYGPGFGRDLELSANGKVLLVSAPFDDSADLNRQSGQQVYGSLYLYNL